MGIIGTPLRSTWSPEKNPITAEQKRAVELKRQREAAEVAAREAKESAARIAQVTEHIARIQQEREAREAAESLEATKQRIQQSIDKAMKAAFGDQWREPPPAPIPIGPYLQNQTTGTPMQNQSAPSHLPGSPVDNITRGLAESRPTPITHPPAGDALPDRQATLQSRADAGKASYLDLMVLGLMQNPPPKRPGAA